MAVVVMVAAMLEVDEMAQKPINQSTPKGAYEPLELQRGGNDSVPMGNVKARDVGPGGPGRGYNVHPSGGQAHRGSNPGLAEPVPSRSADVMNGGKGGR